jgi:hypothetical protein
LVVDLLRKLDALLILLSLVLTREIVEEICLAINSSEPEVDVIEDRGDELILRSLCDIDTYHCAFLVQ